jgi:hypothetical protein
MWSWPSMMKPSTSEVMPVRRCDWARAADLDVALGDAVVVPHHVVVVCDRLCADGVGALVIGQCEHLVGAHLPVWIRDGKFAQPQVGGLAHRFQPADLRDAAVQHDRRSTVRVQEVDVRVRIPLPLDQAAHRRGRHMFSRDLRR